MTAIWLYAIITPFGSVRLKSVKNVLKERKVFVVIQVGAEEHELPFDLVYFRKNLMLSTVKMWTLIGCSVNILLTYVHFYVFFYQRFLAPNLKHKGRRAVNFGYMVDSHEDIAWNVIALGRDFTVRVSEWQEEASLTAKAGQRLLSIADLLEAQVRLIIGTIFVLPEKAARSNWNEGLIHYRNEAEAYAQGQEQLDYYHALAARDERVQLIQSAAELDNFIASMDSQPAKLGLIISMEGADPITEPEQLLQWVGRGLRLIGPAWKGTRYCGGTGEPGPLTPAGHKLLAEMERLGVILDVSHMAEESFYQSLEAYKGTVIASHSNCRHYVNTDRQLSDDMIKQLLARDAVIGTVLYNRFLTGGTEANLGDVIKHMSHICELAGHTRSIAIGSDYDGGFGVETIPQPMQKVGDLYMLAEALMQHGFSEADVNNIFHANWVRILRQGLVKIQN